MRVYTVHEPPRPPVSRLERAEELIFVRDGFSSVALVLTPFWLFWNGMWLLFAVYLVVSVAGVYAFASLGVADPLRVLIVVAVHLWIGLEADSLRRWTLQRKGWRMIAAVAGETLAECERRFFDGWLGEPDLDGGEGNGELDADLSGAARSGRAGGPPSLPAPGSA